MKKRIVSIALAVIMVLCTFNTFVFAEDGLVDYLPGLIEYYQELDKPSSSSNTVCNSNGASIGAGGTVRYDFILPFDAATLDITYAADADANLTLTTPRNTYSVTLSASSTTYQVELTPEHLGVTYMSIKSDAAVAISELKYTKIVQQRADNEYFESVVEYTDYQEHLKTAVVVPENATAIKVKNLVRYINFDNTRETTTVVDGKMYLPLGTFARAFSLYYEDYADMTYAYMSGEDFAIYLKPSGSYFESKGVKSAFTDVAIYKNGMTYVPVRQLAEMLGYTVYYKDGLAVIDNKIAANDILSNYTIFSQLKEEMAAYELVPEKTGKTYHVAQTDTATDFGDGTEEVPFATIQKAADIAKAGDTVIIHEGVYREKVTVKNSGTPTQPIIFKAAEGEDVTLSAFKTVSGFETYTNPANNVAMYTKDISDLLFECALEGAWDVDRNFVLYNNDVLVEGRHPNGKTSTAKTVTRYNQTLDATENPEQTEEFTYVETPDPNPAYPDLNTHKLLPTQGDMRIRDVLAKGTLKTYNHTLYSEIDLNQDTDDYWKGATYIGRVGMGWNLSAGLVTASTKNEATVSEKCIKTIPVGTITYYQSKEAEDYGFLTHHLNTVDKAGEWYIDVDAKRMYVIPPEGADPDTMEFEVKERQVLFDMRGKEYVQLHNVNTRGGGITMAECKGCVLNGGTHKYISQLDLSSAHCLQSFDTIYGRYDTILDDYKFEGGEDFKKTSLLGETGFIVTGLYNAVLNTDIEYSAAAGIAVAGSYQYVENNLIKKTGYGITYQSGINVSDSYPQDGYPAGGHQIYQNTVSGAGRASFGAGGAPLAPWDVAFNDFGWANTGATDSGVFYFYGTVGGTDLTKGLVHHNMMHDNVTSDIGSAMTTVFYSDGSTMLTDVYNNVFYHSSDNPTYIMEDTTSTPRKYEFWQLGSNGAFQRHWGNKTKTFASPEEVSFDITDYPNGYPFKAGAIRSSDERFMMNYNRDRDNYVRTLANEVLNWGSYVTDDKLVALPNESSNVRLDDVNIGEKGSKIDIYYSTDIYTKSMLDMKTVTLEFIDENDATVGTITKDIDKFDDYPDVLSHISVYVPSKYADCTSIRMTTTARDVYFAKMIISDFDYDTENAKQTIPYDANVILMGSIDEMLNVSGHTPLSVSETKSHFNVNNYTHLFLNSTLKHAGRYLNRTITKESDEILMIASTNYASCGSKAEIYLGTNASGEKIAEIDYSTAWKEGDYWTQKVVKGTMLRTLEPGTYDFYIKWSGGGTNTSYVMAMY